MTFITRFLNLEHISKAEATRGPGLLPSTITLPQQSHKKKKKKHSDA